MPNSELEIAIHHISLSAVEILTSFRPLNYMSRSHKLTCHPNSHGLDVVGQEPNKSIL